MCSLYFQNKITIIWGHQEKSKKEVNFNLHYEIMQSYFCFKLIWKLMQDIDNGKIC